MKVINTEAAVTPVAKAPNKAYTTLYNRKTGKAQEFHTIDANEILEKNAALWSASPVSLEQAKAEDAEIVAPPAKAPVAEKAPEPESKPEEAVKPVVKDLPRRGRRSVTSED